MIFRLYKVSFVVLMVVLLIGNGLSWWDSDWENRVSVNVTESSDQTLNDFQLKLTMDTSEYVSSGNLKDNCQDLRFIDEDDTTELNHWVESGCGTEETIIWVLLDELEAGSNREIFAYYGNEEASSTANGSQVFIFFDDFSEDEILDHWTDLNDGIDLNQEEHRLEITQGNIYSSESHVSQPDTLVEADLKYTGSIDGDDSGLMIANSGTHSGSNSNSNANVLFISDDTDGTVSTWAGDGETSSYNICSGVETFTASVGEDYIYGIIDKGSEITTLLNYEERTTCNGELTSIYENFVIGLGDFALDSNSDTTDISYNWVRTREFVEIEPKVEIGSEVELNLCDKRGPINECILNSSREIDDSFEINSIFVSTSESQVKAETDYTITVSNSSEISGLWQGDITLSSSDTRLTSGAKFRPNNGNIRIN